MDEKKIPCGGFRVGDGLSIDGDVLKATGEGAVQSDYDENDETSLAYIKNRHGGYNAPKTLIEWDGQVDGREVIYSDVMKINIYDAESYTAPMEFVKISDSPIPYDQLSMGKIVRHLDNDEVSTSETIDAQEGQFIAIGYLGYTILYCAYTKNSAYRHYTAGTPFLFKFATEGVYLSRTSTKDDAFYVTPDAIGYVSKVISSPLPVPFDEEYIPDTIARKNESLSESDVYSSGESTTVIEWDGNTEEKDSFTYPYNNLVFYKISEAVVPFDNLGTCSFERLFSGIIPQNYSGEQYEGISCYCPVGSMQSVIVVTKAGECTLAIQDNLPNEKYTFTAPSTGIYFNYGGSTTTGYKYTQNSVTEKTGIKINSSSKKWKIVVDDSGKISAVEDVE